MNRSTLCCWLMALPFVMVAASLGCSDVSVVGGGGSGGADAKNPYDYSDVSPVCKEWCAGINACGSDHVLTADECVDTCERDRAPGCEKESDDLMACWAEYLAHDCADWTQGCNPVGIVFNECLFGLVECESNADSCSCAGKVYGSDLEASCQVVGDTPTGGAGEGGGAPDLVVECQCKGGGGELVSVCEQTSLECGLIESCCKFAG